MDRKDNFLQATIGTDGAVALRKATSKLPELQAAVLPRTITAWLEVASIAPYDGSIPGGNEHLSFKKNERGFTGSCEINGQNYKFKDVNLLHVASAIAVSLQHAEPVARRISDGDLAKLGKNLDLLVKAYGINSLRKAEGKFLDRFKKASPQGAGPAAKPISQVAPTAPTPPNNTMGIKKPKVKKNPTAPNGMPSVKITKSQAATRCSLCGDRQFDGAEFAGCICWSALAKSVEVTAISTGYALRFGDDWDSDSIEALLENFGVTNDS